MLLCRFFLHTYGLVTVVVFHRELHARWLLRIVLLRFCDVMCCICRDWTLILDIAK